MDQQTTYNNQARQLTIVVLLALLLIPTTNTFAQDNAAAKPARRMTQMDSLLVKQLFFDALHEKITGNANHAADIFQRVLQTDPNNDAALYELANLKKNQGDYAGAQIMLEQATAFKPDNEWYWLSLAECYEKTNNISKLDNAVAQLLRINPAKPEYYFNEANIYFLEKRYDDALAIYDKLEQLTGLDDDILAGRQKIYLIQGKVDQAATEIQEMITADPTAIRYYLLLAELYNSNKFNDKALDVLQNANKINPNNGQVHLALADIYRDKKDYEACFNELKLAFAIPDLDIDQKIKIISGYYPKFPDPEAKAAALELSQILTTTHPADSKGFAVYGDMLAENGKYLDAKAAYKRSIELNGERYEVYEHLVRIELSENALDDVIKDGEEALSLFPNQAWMNYLVGVAYEQKKDLKKALEYLKNAVALETDDKDLLSLAYASLGDTYHDQEDNKSSDDAYDRSLSYNPDNAFALNNYAYYLSVRGEQLDKAATMSAHSNELQPNTASFEDTYAWILFKQKNYADAKVWIEKAIEHDKTNSAVQEEHYGDIMFYLGNTDAAVANWKKAKSDGEQSPVLDRKINERKYVE